MKKSAFILAALMIALPGIALADQHVKEKAAVVQAPKAQGETIHIGVNGMVCDFCAQSLKKVFLKEGAVSSVDISLEDKLITLGLKKDQKIDDATIKKLVVDAGYDVANIHHMPIVESAK